MHWYQYIVFHSWCIIIQSDPAEAQPIGLLLGECNSTISDFGNYSDCDESIIYGLSLVFTVGYHLENTECYSSLQFFCNAIRLLCDGNDSSVNLTKECGKVQDNKCSSEWRIVDSFFNATVPDCLSYEADGNLTFSKAPSLPCPRDFDHFCGSTCLPVCDGHFLVTDSTLDRCFYVLAILCGAMIFIGGIVTLVACYYNQDKM